MTSISITLIRGTHSEFNIDDPEAIQIIKLNKQEIACIDNLEVFSHIRELHLADNLIERIENINFLQNLTFLDLSNNRINSESLLLSIGSIPRNLKDLNLSGNQCAEDESALNALQDGYPDLNIIVGVYVGGEIIESFDGLGFENSRIENPTDSDEDNDSSDDEGEEGDMPLNADEVLKSLVERKCRLQSMETFSVERTTEELNCEFEIAVKRDAERNIRRRLSQSKSSELYSIESFQKRLDAMKEDSAVGNDIKNFQSRLRETVKNAHEAISLKTPIEVAGSEGHQDKSSE